MPRKCCVFDCNTNYDSKRNTQKLSVYRLPSDENEREAWIRAVPNANLTVSKNTVICELHWPDNFEIVKVRGGKLRPKNPPSIWPSSIPPSQIPTTSAPKRTTLRTSNSLRNLQSDELGEFLAKDQVTYSTLKKN